MRARLFIATETSYVKRLARDAAAIPVVVSLNLSRTVNIVCKIQVPMLVNSINEPQIRSRSS